jgi:hypothetical protein
MSDEKEKSYLDYDFEEFRRQMSEATVLLKKMNEAAIYMRWQYPTDKEWEKFANEMSTANGWLSSWCG